MASKDRRVYLLNYAGNYLGFYVNSGSAEFILAGFQLSDPWSEFIRSQFSSFQSVPSADFDLKMKSLSKLRLRNVKRERWDIRLLNY